MKKLAFANSLVFILVALCSCDKGYQVRVTNYSTETLDTVNITTAKIIFTKVDRQTVTGYVKIKSGTYPIQCVTHTKKHYNSFITIDKNGSGKRSIQLDGTGTIDILQD